MSHKAFPTCLPREHPRRKRMSRSPSMGGRFLDVKGFLNQVSNPLLILSRALFQSHHRDREREREKKGIKTKKNEEELDFQNPERGRKNVRSNCSISFFSAKGGCSLPLCQCPSQPFPSVS